VEYALGSGPLTAGAGAFPALTVLGNGSRELRIPKGIDAALDPTLGYRFQTSGDLLNWSSLLAPTTETATEAVFVLPAGPARMFLRFVPISQ